MSITTLDNALAGLRPPVYITKGLSGTLVAGRPVSFWSATGAPGVGTFSGTLAGATYSSSSVIPTGALFHYDPSSGNSYLGRFSAAAVQAGALLLLDRIWDNGGITITSTSAQTITSPTWPARDANGSTNGVGVLLAVEISVATSTGTPTLTVSYTNSAGTSGRTGTNIIATVASAPVFTFYMIGLQAGDVGVQSVQSLTLSATWTSGTIHLVAYRLLAALDLPGAYISNSIDSFTGGFPIIYNGAVPFMVFLPSTTTTTNIVGTYVEAQG